MSDENELYYATMEAGRATSEDAYFAARPELNTPANRALFRAGFERGFGRAWNEHVRHAPTSSEKP